MSESTGHLDPFTRDALPPRKLWPAFETGGLAALDYPGRLNCAAELLDETVAAGHGARPAIRFDGGLWSYAELLDKVNRIAGVLVGDMGLVAGNRVLLRGANTPMLAACWLAVVKAGGVAVAAMPLLRGGELAYIVTKARIGLALVEHALAADFEAIVEHGADRPRTVFFETAAEHGLEARMAGAAPAFAAAGVSSDDICLIAFTSGSTGRSKATMHAHRDVMAICDCFPRSILKPDADDVFIGSPPLAFTFGLGGLLLFPMRFAASSVLLPRLPPEPLMAAIARHKATICFTAPTAYRAMTAMVGDHDVSSLKKCVSAGDALPQPVFEAWRAATGIRIIDGIGATEMLHIFISAAGDDIRPGATGKPIPGYRACVLDEAGAPLPPGRVGRLAVRGPTGCRYLDDPRQGEVVVNGWTLTGDAYLVDEDGYFWHQARTDDMIVSSGYNIAGPEVEAALLDHPAVRECAVVAAPDPQRGQVVAAFVVAHDPKQVGEALVGELQNFVKRRIAPYKYPRAVRFVDALPRTETGKVQRFRLREQAAAAVSDA